ncbi:MAG: EamA family transporter [Gaiellaceae bacterium]
MILRGRGPRVWGALAIVYVVWGSTYLGILLAIRTIPVFTMGALRFLIAGALLYLWTTRRGQPGGRPGWRQWRAAAVVGGLLLLVGNGGVAWAETRVDTGVSSLIIATVPLWMALFDRAAYGQRLNGTSVAGLLVGLAGAGLLAGPTGPDRLDVAGAGALLLSAIAWSAGSLYSRTAPLPKQPLVGASMQMLAGGAMFAVIALVLGEPGRIDHVSTQSILALAYLIVFGSLVAFSAYIWLLRSTSTALVSTYAYVNPVVAVCLGWAIENEPIGPRTIVAGAMILTAVVLIVSARPVDSARRPQASAAAPARAR